MTRSRRQPPDDADLLELADYFRHAVRRGDYDAAATVSTQLHAALARAEQANGVDPSVTQLWRLTQDLLAELDSQGDHLPALLRDHQRLAKTIADKHA